MNPFVNWWETGVGLILLDIALFVMVTISFGTGFKASVAKSKEKKGTVVVTIYKSGFSMICFFSFLSAWMLLTLFMAARGRM